MEQSSGSVDYGVDRNQQVYCHRPSWSEASVGMRKEDAYLQTHSRPYEFCKTVEGLSPEKVAAVNEIGWGHMLDLKITALYGPIWNMMYRAINTKNRTVDICGVLFKLDNHQFTRVMGIADGRVEVEDGRTLTEREESLVNSRLCEEQGNIYISRLVEIVRYREEADYLFKMAFCLYTHTTVLCPGIEGTVNRGLLAALLDTDDIGNKKWASYAINCLLEGVTSDAHNEDCYVRGSMVFLQLLYLDVVGEEFNVVERGLPPISVWYPEIMYKVIITIVHHGGFDCPLVIISRAARQSRLNDFVNRDKTVGIGIDRSVHEDLYESLIRMDSIEKRIAEMTDEHAGHKQGVDEIRKLVLRLVDMFETLSEDIVQRVVQIMLDEGRTSRKRNREDNDKPCAAETTCKTSVLGVIRSQPGCANISRIVGSDVDGMKPHSARRLSLEGDKGMVTPTKDCKPISASSSSPVGPPPKRRAERLHEGVFTKSGVSRGAARVLYNTSLLKEVAFDDIVTFGLHSFNNHDHAKGGQESVHFIAGPFTLQFPLLEEDLQLLNYICMSGASESTIVADIGGGRSVIPRLHMLSLLPDTDLADDVINFYCEFLSRDRLIEIFLPTYFSENAIRDLAERETTMGRIISTTTVCNMYRFTGRMEYCETIFVPMHYGDKTWKRGQGTRKGHWLLLVVHPKMLVAEVWDSAPGFISNIDLTRMVYRTLVHLDEVLSVAGFASGDFIFDLKSCQVIVPPNVPAQKGVAECGIYTIKNMQLYGTTWWNDYNSHGMRLSMMLECLKEPANEIYYQVRQRAEAMHKGTDLANADIDPLTPIEFSNAPGERIETENYIQGQVQEPRSEHITPSTNPNDGYQWTDWNSAME